MSSSQPRSAILWRNDAHTVYLVDIPHSIAVAQGSSDHGSLLSAQALTTPYQNQEPRSAKKKAKLSQNTASPELHAGYSDLLESALSDIRCHHGGPWCLPRALEHRETPCGVKRKFVDTADDVDRTDGIDTLPPKLPCNLFISIAKFCQHSKWLREDDGDGETCPCGSGMDFGLQCNCSSAPMILTLEQSSPNERTAPTSHEFYIPPRASFCLSDCSESRSFHAGIRAHAQAHDSRRKFDFILLDPPWPNRSVRRTHRTPGSSYSNSASLADVHSLLMGMDLDMLMTDDCMVGIWVTNGSAVRELVLGEGGCFDSWGITLIEEWIWLKTTVHGEPVFSVDSVWRKPYEVLLLGQRQTERSMSVNEDQRPALPQLRKKIVVAVPDIHSRKPCLKELIDQLFRHKSEYRVLEVFARHLVAGWFSWGNECIKDNWVGNWHS